MYQDVNVTNVMLVGKTVRVCNSDWTSFAAFDRVAVVNGSVMTGSDFPEAQAVGLVQLLRRVDASVTPSWFVLGGVPRCRPGLGAPPPKPFKTPNGTAVSVRYTCPPGENNITYLHFEVLNVPSSISAALRVLPTLDEELVAALRSFPALQQLQLYVGSGTLVPQLAALSSLEVIELHHYCLRGSVPARLVGGMPNLNSLTVTPVDHAAGGSDPAGGLCGISGTYPDLSHQRFTLY